MAHISNVYIWSWAAAIPLLILILERSQIWLEMRAVCHDENAAELVGLNTKTIKAGACCEAHARLTQGVAELRAPTEPPCARQTSPATTSSRRRQE
jgi:branched-subunit amino acid ABC-type transport system permease component